jgi:hypothetical protein
MGVVGDYWFGAGPAETMKMEEEERPAGDDARRHGRGAAPGLADSLWQGRSEAAPWAGSSSLACRRVRAG